MTYEPGRVCEQCGFESPRAPVCGECETAARYEKRLEELRAELDSARRERDQAAELSRELERLVCVHETRIAQLKSELEEARATATANELTAQTLLVQRDGARERADSARAENERLRLALGHIAAGNISPAVDFARRVLSGATTEEAHRAEVNGDPLPPYASGAEVIAAFDHLARTSGGLGIDLALEELNE